MDESILNNIKKMIGILADDTSFDTDIIININNAFGNLLQLGIGPENGFRITDSTNTWRDYTTDEKILDNIKTFIYIKTKINFDPPLNASLLESYKETLKETEWRLNFSYEINKKEASS